MNLLMYWTHWLPLCCLSLILAGVARAQSNSSSAESATIRIDFGAVEVLSSLLDSSDVAARTKAVAVLISQRTPATVPLLSRALSDAEPRIRRSAAEALGALGNRSAVPALVAALDSSDAETRVLIFRVLVRLGDPTAAAGIAKSLNHGDGGVRREAAEALGKLSNPSVVPALASALDDSDAETRVTMIRVLERFGDPGAAGGIARSLVHSDGAVRREAAEALGKLMATNHAAAMVGVLADSDPKVREAAQESLRTFGAVALPPLGGALAGVDQALREAAGNLLVQFGTNAIPILLPALRQPESRPVAAAALENLREPLGRLFVDGLAGRPGAMEAFAATRHPMVPELLLRATADSEFTARREAAVAGLALTPGPTMRVRLLELLADPTPAIRAAAVRSIGGMATSESANQTELVGALLAAARDKESAVGFAAKQSIASLGRRPEMLQAFATFGGNADHIENRALALSQLVRIEGFELGAYLRACRTVLLSPASLLLLPGAIAIGAFFGAVWLYGMKPRFVPGFAGSAALAFLWVAMALYFPAMAATRGSAVFFSVALLPAVLAVAGGGVAGSACWWLAKRQVDASVCRHHYVRFVPGPKLGWVERWTGRQWIRHRGSRAGVKAMVADAVCRDHGCSDRLGDVKRVVAVLDDGAGWGTTWMKDGVLRVNWIKYRKPFDFEAVEIDSASVADVQEFVRQVRFESPERLRQALPRMECVVGFSAQLDEATIRVLTPVFGKVTLKGNA